MISYANGKYIPSDEVAFPIIEDAVGSIRGYRIFTACKTVNGAIFRFDCHVARLWNSANVLGMQLPHSKDELKRIMDTLIDRNRAEPGERLFEIFYSGGPSAGNGTSPVGPAQLYILVLPLRLPDASWYSKGVSLATFKYQRPFPEIKLTFYVGAVVAHQTVVAAHNADLPLFVTDEASPEILEGSTFNFFVVQKGHLKTPSLDGRILDGITRRSVIDVATREGREVIEASVPLDYRWDEAFLVSSTRNIVPVTRVDDHVIGNGQPGPVTLAVMERFAEEMPNWH